MIMINQYFRSNMEDEFQGVTGSSFEDRTTLYFREAEPGDTLIIETLNSTYRFTLIDPANGRGLLTGGAIGDQIRVAILTGSLEDSCRSLAVDSDRLRAGARALFYLEVGSGVKSLIISKVIGLSRVSDQGARRLIA